MLLFVQLAAACEACCCCCFFCFCLHCLLFLLFVQKPSYGLLWPRPSGLWPGPSQLWPQPLPWPIWADFGRVRPIWANFAHPSWLGRFFVGKLIWVGPSRFWPTDNATPDPATPDRPPPDRPKISRLSFLLPPHFHSFFLSLGIFSSSRVLLPLSGVFSLNFGGVLVGRDLKCRPQVVLWKPPAACRETRKKKARNFRPPTLRAPTLFLRLGPHPFAPPFGPPTLAPFPRPTLPLPFPHPRKKPKTDRGPSR